MATTRPANAIKRDAVAMIDTVHHSTYPKHGLPTQPNKIIV
jgi:hypothetical protein